MSIFTHIPNRITKTTVALGLTVVFILGSSYQTGRKDLVQLENAYLPELSHALKGFLSDSGLMLSSDKLYGEALQAHAGVKEFYAANGYIPVWTFYNNLNSKATGVLQLLAQARDFGLEPENYHLEALNMLQQQLASKERRKDYPELRKQTELLLTDAVLCFMLNLQQGYPNVTADSMAARRDNIVGTFQQAIQDDHTAEGILSVQPAFVEYKQLQLATRNYLRTVDLTREWIGISSVSEDSVRFRDEVRQVLIRLGYLAAGAGDGTTEGLMRFQRYHGLEPDGKPGKNTLDALHLTALYHYRLLVLNLDRLRKQDNSNPNMLYVNIPAFTLKVFDNNKLHDTYRVIVGKPDSPTPRLTSAIERIIANPNWHVPSKISRNEILPKLKSDSTYLKRNRFRLLDENNNTVKAEDLNFDEMSAADFNFKLQQDAGSDNALGQVKFIFANPYAVYLHDTPGKTLFNKDIRAFSHGCIRVQNPGKLAGYIAAVAHSDSINIAGLIATGHHHEIRLAKTMPIHIRYITCEADANGGLYFYRDIYGIDEKELAALEPFRITERVR